MQKKITIGLFAILFFYFQSTLTYAYVMPQTTYGKGKAYLGVAADLSINVGNTPSEWEQFGRPGGIELFLGYGVKWTPYLFSAIEGFGTSVMRNNYTWGIRLVPGLYLLDRLMGFGYIGYVYGTNFPYYTTHPPASNGLHWGFGLQLNLDPRFSLRGGWYRNEFNVGPKPVVLSRADQFYISFIYNFFVSPGLSCPNGMC